MKELNHVIHLNNGNKFNKLLRCNISMLHYFGYITFSYQKYQNFHYYRGIFVIIFLTICAIFGSISISPMYFNLSLSLISTTIASLLLLITAIFQIIGFLINRKYFVKILQFINDDLNMILYKNAPADHILFYYKYVKRTKQINLVLWTAGLASGGLMLIGTISFYIFKPEIFQLEQILTAKPIPFILAIFPYRNMTSNIFIAYILPIIGFLMGVLLIPGWHSFSFGLSMYALYRIKFINYKLRTFRPPNLMVNSKMYHQIMKQHFSSSIQELIMIKKYLRDLEVLIAPPVFFDFILCSILICFLLYCISMDSNGIYTPIYVIFLFAIILTQFLHHGLATSIAVESDMTSLSIFLSPWYTYPLIYQKICLIMMMNSRTLQLRAYIFQIKLGTFIKILRASYSFFTLLKNFAEPGVKK